MAQQAPVFALAPGVHGGAVFINFGVAEGQKLFKNMTATLKDEFDCTPRKLKVFLSNLGDRAGQYGWDNVLEVPEVVGAAQPVNRNLLSEYGRITLEQVTAHATAYIALQTRQAQNSYALCLCIMACGKTAYFIPRDLSGMYSGREYDKTGALIHDFNTNRIKGELHRIRTISSQLSMQGSSS